MYSVRVALALDVLARYLVLDGTTISSKIFDMTERPLEYSSILSSLGPCSQILLTLVSIASSFHFDLLFQKPAKRNFNFYRR